MINIRATWDQYLAPTTTLSFEEALEKIPLTLEMTPLDTVNSLKQIANQYGR